MYQVTSLPPSNLRVADAMRLFGLSARALRFYEERGLIEAGRDRHNRRFYDAEARRRLEWITRLRAADLPLADIREVLQAEDRNQQGQDFALAKLHAQRRRVEAALVEVDRAIRGLEPHEPQVRRGAPGPELRAPDLRAPDLRAIGGSALARA
jgi:DNA-binding transcriptional MerR regulator